MAIPRALPLLVLSVLPLGGCQDPRSPQQRIRAVMQQAERAVEHGDLDGLMELVAPDYRDAAGRDRNALRGLVALYLRQNRQLWVVYQEKSLTLDGPDRGEVDAVVALAARPPGSGLDLRRASADLLRVRVTLERRDGDFVVVEADWDEATLADFALD